MKRYIKYVLSFCVATIVLPVCAQSTHVYIRDKYQSQIDSARCEHHFLDKVDKDFKPTLVDYMKAIKGTQFKNPNMTYVEKADISKFVINGKPLDEVVKKDLDSSEHMHYEAIEKLIQIGGECIAYLPDALAENFMFGDALNGARNIRYQYNCTNIQHHEKNRITYDSDCYRRRDMAYLNCSREVGKASGTPEVLYAMQACQQMYRDFAANNCTPHQDTTHYETCEGEGYFVGRNHYGEAVVVIPFSTKEGEIPSVSPNLDGIPYKRVVQAMEEKYGPATLSIRRTHTIYEDECSNLSSVHIYENHKKFPGMCKKCADDMAGAWNPNTTEEAIEYAKCQQLLSSVCEKQVDTFTSETYYWLAKPWVLRIQAIFPRGLENITDDVQTQFLSTMFINWEAYAKQDTYETEREIKEINDALKAQQEAEEKARQEKEDKINNFKL